MEFDVQKVTKDCILWIQNWFEENGNGCKAVIGISGGKDSSVVAALCVRALGKDRVLGVLMPDGEQVDINAAFELVQHLDIPFIYTNIKTITEATTNRLTASLGRPLSSQSSINMPARIRMTVLYAISQSNNGRVANTCNLSEDWVGYATRYGDGAGDFSPLSNLTVTEVRMIGRELGLPSFLVDKVPTDGLCGKTDEDNLGFTYAALDTYIRTGMCSGEVGSKIDSLHAKNIFKMQPMPSFQPCLSISSNASIFTRENSTCEDDEDDKEEDDEDDESNTTFSITEQNINICDVPPEYTIAHCLSGDYQCNSGLAAALDDKFNIKCLLDLCYAPADDYDKVGLTLPTGRVLNLIIKAHASDRPARDEFYEALEDMALYVLVHDITYLAIPKLGCGHNGFNWEDVKKQLVDLFKESNVKILVCTI